MRTSVLPMNAKSQQQKSNKQSAATLTNTLKPGSLSAIHWKCKISCTATNWLKQLATELMEKSNLPLTEQPSRRWLSNKWSCRRMNKDRGSRWTKSASSASFRMPTSSSLLMSFATRPKSTLSLNTVKAANFSRWSTDTALCQNLTRRQSWNSLSTLSKPSTTATSVTGTWNLRTSCSRPNRAWTLLSSTSGYRGSRLTNWGRGLVRPTMLLLKWSWPSAKAAITTNATCGPSASSATICCSANPRSTQSATRSCLHKFCSRTTLFQSILSSQIRRGTSSKTFFY